MRTIGLIPARGGSRRLPHKNILPCAGKPLIDWTIDAALASRLDGVYVSTEDTEIADHARCEVILRPMEYATDTASSEDVIRHALTQVECDRVMLLQPTSPLRTAEHINDCLDMDTPLVSVYEDGTVLRRNGAIYLMDRDALMRFHAAYIMDRYSSVDVDTKADFDLAEVYLLCRGA